MCGVRTLKGGSAETDFFLGWLGNSGRVWSGHTGNDRRTWISETTIRTVRLGDTSYFWGSDFLDPFHNDLQHFTSNLTKELVSPLSRSFNFVYYSQIKTVSRLDDYLLRCNCCPSWLKIRRSEWGNFGMTLRRTYVSYISYV